MGFIVRCDACGAEAPVERKLQEVAPMGWWVKDQTTGVVRNTACSETCTKLAIQVETGKWRQRVPWDGVQRNVPPKPLVGSDNCKICTSMRAKGRTDKCLFHRPKVSK